MIKNFEYYRAQIILGAGACTMFAFAARAFYQCINLQSPQHGILSLIALIACAIFMNVSNIKARETSERKAWERLQQSRVTYTRKN